MVILQENGIQTWLLILLIHNNGIHIIDSSNVGIGTVNSLNKIANSGRKILFVATKKQAKDLVQKKLKN